MPSPGAVQIPLDPKLRKTFVLSYRVGLEVGIPILRRPLDKPHESTASASLASRGS